MNFDPCEHRIRAIIIEVGKVVRQIKQMPEEQNISILYEEACLLLGMPTTPLRSDKIDHLPTPAESARTMPESELIRICPQCEKKAYVMRDLCSGCKDAEGGKYKVKFECFECGHEERSEDRSVVWLERWNIDFTTQTKKSLGILTLTDDGLK